MLGNRDAAVIAAVCATSVALLLTRSVGTFQAPLHIHAHLWQRFTKARSCASAGPISELTF